MDRTLLRCTSGLLVLWASGCVETYVPEVVNAPNRYLVVDGFINGNGRTRIKLSLTENVATTDTPPGQKGATIYIVDDTGQRYIVPETSVAGSYSSDSLLLNPNRRYRLRISLGTVSSTSTYESDLVSLKVSPLFQLMPKLVDDQVQLSINTQDGTGQSRYYRWRYTETWEFNTAYNSTIEAHQGVLQTRKEPIYTCWHTEQSSAILHTSTAGLSQDQLKNWPLTNFSNRAERFIIRYSVLVSQYVETPEEFAYLELLRKNTEAVGTVNDPLPVQLTGNVHRLDKPAEPVLGFVSAHTVQYQRLFITPQSLGLPTSWVFNNPYQSCELLQEFTPAPGEISAPLKPGHTRLFAGIEQYPIDVVIKNGDSIANTGASRFCVDCTMRGTNHKPTFW